VQEATAAAAAVGDDAAGEIRVDESFTAATLSLTEEVGPSFAILDWSVSRVPTDLMFGHEVDLVGERSPIPRVFRPGAEPPCVMTAVSHRHASNPPLTDRHCTRVRGVHTFKRRQCDHELRLGRTDDGDDRYGQFARSGWAPRQFDVAPAPAAAGSAAEGGKVTDS
jgi:hypothetical protein